MYNLPVTGKAGSLTLESLTAGTNRLGLYRCIFSFVSTVSCTVMFWVRRELTLQLTAATASPFSQTIVKTV